MASIAAANKLKNNHASTMHHCLILSAPFNFPYPVGIVKQREASCLINPLTTTLKEWTAKTNFTKYVTVHYTAQFKINNNFN